MAQRLKALRKTANPEDESQQGLREDNAWLTRAYM